MGQEYWEDIFFFLISKSLLISKKMEHPSTQGVYKGSNNQEQKLQESKKTRKDEKDWNTGKILSFSPQISSLFFTQITAHEHGKQSCNSSVASWTHAWCYIEAKILVPFVYTKLPTFCKFALTVSMWGIIIREFFSAR